MAITREEVLHVARLARLAVTGAEADRLREQLSGILEYVTIYSREPNTKSDGTARTNIGNSQGRQQVAGLYAGQLVWKKPSDAALYDMLRNPAYAGAFVYGRHRPHPDRGGDWLRVPLQRPDPG